MKISHFVGGVFLFLFSVFCSWAADVINLPVLEAKLKGARLEDNGGVRFITDFNRKGNEISWDIDVPEAGSYIVELVFRCKGESPGKPFLFKCGKAALPWSPFGTGDRGKRRHLGKMDLAKGKQTFSFVPLQDHGIDVVSARLIPSPGFTVSPSDDGVFDLRADLADVSRINAYEEGLLCDLGYGNPARWNLNVPEGMKYRVTMKYASPVNITMDIVLPSGTARMEMPASGSWYNLTEKEVGMITLPPGEYALELKKGTGNADVDGIRLTRDVDSEKELEALKKKGRVGMTRGELDMIWGAGRFCPVASVDRRGGKEDVDWELYKGVSALSKCYEWNKPGMKIVASFIQDRCFALTLNMEDKSLKAMKEITEVLMPGVKFKWNPAFMTFYSEDNRYKVQYWGSYFEIKDSGALRSLKEKGQLTEEALKGPSRFGLTLDELKKVLGTGGHDRSESSIARKGGKGDTDWDLYNAIRPVTTAYMWEYPKDNYHVTAVFWKGKCIAFDISQNSRINVNQALEKASEFIPAAVFGSLPSTENFTVYSTNLNKGYKLQGWDLNQGAYTYIEIKASGLIREMLKAHEEGLKKAVVKTISVLRGADELKKSPLIGRTRADIDAILGLTSEDSKVEYNGKPTCVWKLPEGDLKLYGSFVQTGQGLVCAQITLVDAMRQLQRYIALPVATQIVSPAVMEKVDKENADFWRTIKSRDRGGRFLFEWYDDRNGGPALRITDTSILKQQQKVAPAAQKSDGDKPGADLDDIRKIL